MRLFSLVFYFKTTPKTDDSASRIIIEPMVSLTQIQALQQPAESYLAHLQHLLFRLRPSECFFFQPLHPDAESVFRPIENFNNILPAVTKSKEATGEEVKLKLFLNEERQTVYRFTHISYANSDVDSEVMFYAQHQIVSKVAMSLLSVDSENSFSRSILNLSLQRDRRIPVKNPLLLGDVELSLTVSG